MDDRQLLRYSRHILLDEIGVEGQQRIAASRILVVGAGGLGSPAALYLVAAGVARLTLVDDDAVDLTNLQRQVLHATERIGQQKVASARAALHAVNPDVEVVPVASRATAGTLPALVGGADIVLDCTDNFATRHAINRACVAARRPLVSGAAIRFAGQLAVFDLRRPQSPCYACVFPEGEGEDEACSLMGVFAPLTGWIGAMQAGEALKLAVGLPTVAGKLMLVDALANDVHTVTVEKTAGCPVCGNRDN